MAISFKSIGNALDEQMKIPVSKNPYLIGNYAPISKEYSYELEGVQAPKDITGFYLRNGPNAKVLTKSNRVHLFDGDGMVHAMKIKDGKLFYSNRYN
jgi:carotenoid cleavage dioxygenase